MKDLPSQFELIIQFADGHADGHADAEMRKKAVELIDTDSEVADFYQQMQATALNYKEAYGQLPEVSLPHVLSGLTISEPAISEPALSELPSSALASSKPISPQLISLIKNATLADLPTDKDQEVRSAVLEADPVASIRPAAGSSSQSVRPAAAGKLALGRVTLFRTRCRGVAVRLRRQIHVGF